MEEFRERYSGKQNTRNTEVCWTLVWPTSTERPWYLQLQAQETNSSICDSLIVSLLETDNKVTGPEGKMTFPQKDRWAIPSNSNNISWLTIDY